MLRRMARGACGPFLVRGVGDGEAMLFLGEARVSRRDEQDRERLDGSSAAFGMFMHQPAQEDGTCAFDGGGKASSRVVIAECRPLSLSSLIQICSPLNSFSSALKPELLTVANKAPLRRNLLMPSPQRFPAPNFGFPVFVLLCDVFVFVSGAGTQLASVMRLASACTIPSTQACPDSSS